SATNTVKLRPLSESYPNFPSARLPGWGQRLMGVDPIAGRFTGNGVRIGIIDSGCDNSHPLLRHVTRGKDFTTGGADTGWTHDFVSHGTHCAGIINAASTEQGVSGCAPEAELHVFKVIPEGRAGAGESSPVSRRTVQSALRAARARAVRADPSERGRARTRSATRWRGCAGAGARASSPELHPGACCWCGRRGASRHARLLA